MAGTTETLTLKLQAQHEAFLRTVKEVDGTLAGLGKSIAAVTIAGAGMFTLREAARGFDAAVVTAIDFETKLSQVRKTTGVTGSALLDMRDKLVTLGTTFGGFKLDELFDTAALSGRLGIAGDKLVEFTRDIALTHVAIQDVPADELATSMGRILNVFGLGTESAIRLGSAINKLDDSSTATARDIMEVTRRLSGPAAALGLAPQKVLALATALKEAGVSNEVGGTAIAQVFSKMATRTQDFADVAGVSLAKFSSALRGDPLVAIQLFQRGLQGLDAVDQFKALEGLGLDGTRVKSTMLQLNAVMDKIPGFVSIANNEWRTLGSVLKENEIAGNTTKSQLERLRSALQGIAIQIGDAALPIVKALAKSFVDLSGVLSGFLDRHKEGISAIGEGLAKAARAAGLFVTEFGLFVALGTEIAIEKFKQLAAVISRIGKQIGNNFKVVMSNAMAVLRNVLEGTGIYIASFFEQAGGIAASKFAKGLATSLPDFVMKIIRRLDPEIAAGLEALAKLPTPGFHPNTSGLTAAALGRGVQDLPGFKNPFINLPNRAKQINPLVAQVQALAQGAEARAEEQRKKLLPKPQEANPFEGRKAAQLKGDRAKLQKEQQDLARQGRLLKTKRTATLRTNRGRRADAGTIAPPIMMGPGAAMMTGFAQLQNLAGTLSGQIAVNAAQQRALKEKQEQLGQAEAAAAPARRNRGRPVPREAIIADEPEPAGGVFRSIPPTPRQQPPGAPTAIAAGIGFANPGDIQRPPARPQQAAPRAIGEAPPLAVQNPAPAIAAAVRGLDQVVGVQQALNATQQAVAQIAAKVERLVANNARLNSDAGQLLRRAQEWQPSAQPSGSGV